MLQRNGSSGIPYQEIVKNDLNSESFGNVPCPSIVGETLCDRSAFDGSTSNCLV